MLLFHMYNVWSYQWIYVELFGAGWVKILTFCVWNLIFIFTPRFLQLVIFNYKQACMTTVYSCILKFIFHIYPSTCLLTESFHCTYLYIRMHYTYFQIKYLFPDVIIFTSSFCILVFPLGTWICVTGRFVFVYGVCIYYIDTYCHVSFTFVHLRNLWS